MEPASLLLAVVEHLAEQGETLFLAHVEQVPTNRRPDRLLKQEVGLLVGEVALVLGKERVGRVGAPRFVYCPGGPMTSVSTPQ
jgi:hypothetical protein